MKFQDDISNMNTYIRTYIHTDKPKPICPLLFQSWGHNNMEAKNKQNVYNHVMVVVISSKDCFWSIHFQDLVKKFTKRLTIISFFRFKLCIASFLSNNNLAPFDNRSH